MTADAGKLVDDPWLTDLFGYPVRHLPSDASLDSANLAPHSAERLFTWTKVDVADVQRVNDLENAGFSLVDTNVQLEKSCDSGAPILDDGLIRLAAPGDAESVARIAAEGFEFSRFHLDPLISDSLANRIKKEWASNYFKGNRGDLMGVALVDGKVAGFIQVLQSIGNSTIDLIAVDKDHRGRGLAKAMIRFVATQLDVACIRVGTQLSNIASLNLYESMRFRIIGAQYVFHYHLGARNNK